MAVDKINRERNAQQTPAVKSLLGTTVTFARNATCAVAGVTAFGSMFLVGGGLMMATSPGADRGLENFGMGLATGSAIIGAGSYALYKYILRKE